MLKLVLVRVDRFRGHGCGSESLSPAPNLRGSISIAGIHKGYLWWTKCRWNKLFYALYVFLVNITPLMRHIFSFLHSFVHSFIDQRLIAELTGPLKTQ